MRVTPASSPRMAKSNSVGVLEHEPDMHIVDQDDIIGLTLDVKNFSDGLAKLKGLFTEQYDIEGDEDLKVLAHMRLGDVLCTLKSVLQKYPPLNTTELFSAAGTLIGKIKSFNYEDHSCEGLETAFSDAIDQLALEFSNSVSEYLMGDLQHSYGEETVKTRSYDNLLSVSHETADDTEEEKEPVVKLTAQQIDAILMRLQAGLDLTFQRAKAWSKYLKDIMAYIEKRSQLEVEYSKNLSRLAATVKPALTEEGFLPLQSVYCTVLSQDVEYARTCQATFTLLQTTKFIEPLTARRNEHDKARKSLKDTWLKEVKKMQESVNNLRKAQSMYVTRQQEYEKAKELSQKTESDALQSTPSSNLAAKVDKKRKAEEDAALKAAEAETTYKACVAEANSRQADIQKTKADLLANIRDQILLSDQVIKKVTIDYFQLLQTVSAPVPVQYNTLCEASKRYEPGSQYQEFVRRLPVSQSTTVHMEDFKFEPYNSKGGEMNRKTSTQSNESASSDHHSGEGSPSPRRQVDKYRVNAWQGGRTTSDTDSQSGSSKSLDSSPCNSPHPSGSKKKPLASSMDDLIEDEQLVSPDVKNLLAVPGTDPLDIHKILQRHGRRRNTTFGVSFQEQVEHYHSAIPPIISKCLKEVERRGITVKGIYRVSGVKSTVENLCQKFENDPESVNLEEENPNVISNVLKLYLRQLPEPLLTFKLYQNFIQVAKDNMSGNLDMNRTVERFLDLIDKLPFSNRKTCGVLMHHLKKVASISDQNHMNASNLGIVFGPTLLRPQGGNASLACLVDTPHQTRVVELLIINAENLFGPMEDHMLIHGETMVEQMEHKHNTLLVPQTATVELPKDDQSSKPEPKREQSPTVSTSKPELLLTSQLPSSSNTQREHSQKSVNEDMVLPGSAGIDKRESGQPSDGNLRGRAVSTMTPPLNHRQGNKILPSPSSSPNLSIRSAPPIIRIESSAPDLQTDPGSQSDISAMQQKVLQLPPVNTWIPKGESLFNTILDSRSPQVYRRTLASNKPALFPQGSQGSIQSSRVSWPQRSQSHIPQLSPPVSRHSMASTQSEHQDLDKSPKLLRKCTSFDMERSKPFPARSMMSSPMLLKKGTSVDESENGQFQSSKMSKWSANSALEFESDRIVHQEEDESHFTDGSNSEFMYSDNFPLSIARESSLNVDIYGSDDVLEFDACKINESLDDPNIPETAILNDIVNECNQIAEVDGHFKQPDSTDPFSYGSSPELGAKPKSQKVGHDVMKRVGKSKASKESNDSPILKTKKGPSSTKSDKSSDGSDRSKSKTSTSTVKTALLSSAAKLKAMSRKSPVTLLSYKSHSITVPDQTERPERPFSTSDIDTDPPVKMSRVHQTESSPTVLLSEGVEFESKAAADKVRSSPAMKRGKKTSLVQSKIDMLTSRKTTRPCEGASDKRLVADDNKVTKSKTGSKIQTDKTPDKSSKTLEKVTKTEDKSSKTQEKSTKNASSSKTAFTRPRVSAPKMATKSSLETSEPLPMKKKSDVKSTVGKKEMLKDVKPKDVKLKDAKAKDVKPKDQKDAKSKDQKDVKSKDQKDAKSKDQKDVKSKDQKDVKPKDLKPKSRLTTKRDSVSSVNSDSSKKSDHFHDCCHVRRKPADRK